MAALWKLSRSGVSTKRNETESLLTFRELINFVFVKFYSDLLFRLGLVVLI